MKKGMAKKAPAKPVVPVKGPKAPKGNPLGYKKK